jgi:hypothetical protein
MLEDREMPLQIDLPIRRELLQGREVTIACVADAAHREAPPVGANPFGFAGTTTLATVALYLGGAVSESELVSLGLRSGLCSRSSDAALSGGVSQEDLLRLLSDCRAPGRAERGYSLEDLAHSVESGSRVIAFVNAGELWDRSDEPSLSDANCAVVIEGVARDAQSQEICGFLVRDPTAPDTSVFVDAARTGRMWLDTGGWQIVPVQPSL